MSVTTPSTSGTYSCSTAPGVVFQSREELNAHYKSDLHRYNLRRKAAGLAPISKEVFERVQKEYAARTEQPVVKKADHLKDKSAPAPAAASTSSSTPTSAPKEKELEEGENPDESEAELAARVAKAAESFEYDPTWCLWERVASVDIASNLEHMHRHHGFVVPDLDFCTDLAGLLRYCAEKIWVGHVCLWCDKAFRSGEATATHMTIKGHCRIPWDYEDEVDEYSDYYDFAAQQQQQQQQGEAYVDPLTNELVLVEADGTEQRFGSKEQRHRYGRMVREAYSTALAVRGGGSGRARGGASASASPAGAAMASQREKALQLYRGAGLPTSSALALDAGTRRRLTRLQKERRFAMEARMQRELQVGEVGRLNMKNNRAGKNVGVGHFIHG